MRPHATRQASGSVCMRACGAVAQQAGCVVLETSGKTMDTLVNGHLEDIATRVYEPDLDDPCVHVHLPEQPCSLLTEASCEST